jgi:hypothetical protein
VGAQLVQKITSCVIDQLLKFIGCPPMNCVNFMVYKKEGSKVDEEILKNIKGYDEKLDVCEKINEYLANCFRNAGNSAVTANSSQPLATTKSQRHLSEITYVEEKYKNFLKFPETHTNHKRIWRNWYKEQKTAAEKGGATIEWGSHWKNLLELEKEKELKLLEDNASVGELQIDEPDECVLVEQNRVVIEVTDDEEEEPAEKRPRMDSEDSRVIDSTSGTSVKARELSEPTLGVLESPVKVSEAPEDRTLEKETPIQKSILPPHEKDSLIVAIQIAHQLIKDNREPSSKELKRLVNLYFNSEGGQSEDDQEFFDFSGLTDEDFVILSKNFAKLSRQEQEVFLKALKEFEVSHPERFRSVSRSIKENM